MEIMCRGVRADYQLGPIRSARILHELDLHINSGACIAVIGHTGAGKSSLLKLVNGLLLPVEGHVKVGNTVIKPGNNKQALKKIRQQVGMVFQFPEAQLFAETVEQDICFGPQNFGVPEKTAKEIARNVIQQIGLDATILSKSPFSLSGGQKRRVAIAGILAMKPQILVLDEPGAGLDPIGKKEIFSLLSTWQKEQGLTTLFVTHDMDDVAQYADEVVVMEKGSIVMHGETRKVFSQAEKLAEWNLELPEARRFQLKIEQSTGIKLPKICLNIEELSNALIEVGLA